MEWGPDAMSANGGQNGPNSGSDTKRPYLEILVEPQAKFRFRYKSEMTGKHGSLIGVPGTGYLRPGTPPSPSSQNGSKLYPTVKVRF